jgi:hypothetical protein
VIAISSQILFLIAFVCLSGRNHRGARRIESPADGKSRMRPKSSQCMSGDPHRSEISDEVEALFRIDLKTASASYP